jgi:tellurite resistance protein
MTESAQGSRIQHFPISFFAMVMGLAGLSIAWQKARHVLGLALPAGEVILALAALTFVLLAGAYLSKLLRFRTDVLAELRHPVKLNFFPTISISLILLAVGLLPLWPAGARPLWLLGTVLHLWLTLYVVNIWIHHEHFEVHHINPAWFIPVVGNVLVPVAGVPLGFGEVSWFFFSIGMVFWLVLFTIIFYRMLFHHPLPDRLMPTLFIFIAPPAVGFIAWFRLTGEVDAVARVLYYTSLFLTLLLLVQVRRFARLRFFLSWWAYSFPLAAITVATLVMREATGRPVFTTLSWILLCLLTLIVVVLLYRTARAVRGRRICVPEN